MITFLSHKLHKLMIVLLAVVGISFIFFGNWTPHGSQNFDVGKINGQTVTGPNFAIAQTAATVIFVLQNGRTPEQAGVSSDEMYSRTWNRLLILKAAEKSGIQIGDDQVVQYIRSLPVFQKDGKYDPASYELFDQNFLSPRAISLTRLMDIVRDELKFESVVESIAQTAFVQPTEVSTVLDQLYGSAEVSVIRFDLSQFQSQLKPTAEELKSFYDKNIASFQTPEKRQVQHLAFKLTPEQLKLTGRDRMAAMQVAGQKAFDFSQSLTPDTATQVPSFEEAAKTAKQTVATSGFVGAEEILLGDASMTLAAFKLSDKSPISEVLEGPDGYYVLKLSAVQPAQAIPFAQAEPKVRQEFIRSTAFQKIREDSVKAREALSSKLAAGTAWPAALQGTGLTATDLPAFVPGDGEPGKVANGDVIRAAVTKLNPGQLSQILQTNEGVILVYMKKRSAADEAKRAKIGPALLAKLEEQARYQVIGDWVLSLSRAKGTQNPNFGPKSAEESGS